MARVRAKLRELKEADAQFVSLVARGANRIPFRIVKKDKEHSMIDLTSIGRVFKREADQRAADLAAQVPQVAALVVLKTSDEQLAAVEATLVANGFSVEKAIHNDDFTVLYPQMDEPEVDSVAVKVSDNLIAVMKQCDLPHVDGVVDVASIPTETAALKEFVAKREAVEAQVPANVFVTSAAIDAALLELASKAALNNQSAIEDVNPERTPSGGVGGAAGVAAGSVVDAAAAAQGSMELKAPAGFDSAVWDGLNEKQKLAVLNALGKKGSMEPDDDENIDPKTGKPYPPKEPVVDPTTPAPAKPACKDDKEAIEATLAPMMETIKNLTSTLENVVKTQKEQAEVVKTLSEKSEQVEKVVKGTVVAPARAADQPAGGTNVAKKSDDSRSGCFDTAFLPKK